ncbi:MAG: guanylate kinase [SAR86 cluster bacterium]|nr:guanylate kinase [SAR86 cluster bacterium]
MAKLIVIAAPSGAGKTSLIQALLEEAGDLKFTLSISYTTREKRVTEKHGESYYFISNKEFKHMIKEKEFLEYADVFGDLKGTSKSWVENKIKKGWNVILELDWQGASQVKNIYPDSETIFILPPSYDDLKIRLNKRGLDKKEAINSRLAEAKEEIKQGQNFDHLIVNDQFKEALTDLKSIIIFNKEITDERKELVSFCLKGLLEEKTDIL